MFKKICLLLLIVTFSYGCQREEVKKFKWKLQVQSPEANLDYSEIVKMAKKIKVMSSGQLDITVYPGGAKAITKGPKIFDGVKEGTTEMAAGWPNWWLKNDNAWAILQGSPYLFMNFASSMMYFHAGEGTKLANELANKHGIIWRPGWWAGMELGLVSKSPISSLKDLKGKKIRIGPGIPSDVLVKAAGAYAIPAVPSKIKTLLENNLLDGVEWTTANGTYSMNFHKKGANFTNVTRHIIAPAVWQPSVLSDILISKKAFDSLPANLQQILETAINEYNLLMTLRGKKADMEAFENFKKEGVSVKRWPVEDFKAWKNASESIYSKHLNKSQSFKKIFESKINFKKRYDEYMKVFGPYDK